MLDVLCGVLLGGPRMTGQFCWALDPARFLPPKEFRGRMDEFIGTTKGGRRREGVAEIFIPGERGQRRRQTWRERGVVPLGVAAWREVQEAAAEFGQPLPEVIEHAGPGQ